MVDFCHILTIFCKEYINFGVSVDMGLSGYWQWEQNQVITADLEPAIDAISQGWQKRSRCSGFGRTCFAQGKNELPFLQIVSILNKNSIVIFRLLGLLY